MKRHSFKIPTYFVSGLIALLFLGGGIGASNFSCSGGDDCRSCLYSEIEDMINNNQCTDAKTKADAHNFPKLSARADLCTALQSVSISTILDASTATDLINAFSGADANALNRALDSGALGDDEFLFAFVAFVGATGNNSPGPPEDAQVTQAINYVSSLSDVPTEVKDALQSGGTYCTTWTCICTGPLNGIAPGC